MRVGIAGATGFVGRALVAALSGDHEVMAFSRHAPALGGATGIALDVGDEEAATRALAGCRAAYYLVHSLQDADFRSRDRRLAETFGRAAARAGVERIVYLGGLGHDPASEHLASRQEVGVALGAAGVPVVELRAAVVLGSGSISFEMLRSLTERLPFMVCPRWVRTAIQPVALVDMVEYLVGSLTVAPGVYEIGGAEVTTYRDMIDAYARARGLRQRFIVDVPYLTPRLSSYWVDFVTPVDKRVSHALIESLVTEVVVREGERTVAAFAVEPLGVEAAIRRARSTIRPQRSRARCSTGRAVSTRACTPSRSPSRSPAPRRLRSTPTSTASAVISTGTGWDGAGGCGSWPAASWVSVGAPDGRGSSNRALASTGG